MAITFWRNVQRKITTQEMDASFDTLVNDIANAGLSAEMPDGQIYIGDNTNTASLETLDTSIVPETTDKRYQSDLQDTYNDATSSIQGQIDGKESVITKNATNTPLVWTSANGIASFQPLPVLGDLTYYLTNTASDVATYYKQTTTPQVALTSLPFASVTNGQLLATFVSEPNNPNRLSIPDGQYLNHLHLGKTGGTKDLQVRAEIWETTSAGVDVVKLADLGPSTLITGSGSTEYIIGYNTVEKTLSAVTSRIATKIYAVISGGGSAPSISIFQGDGSDSRSNLPAPVVDATNYVPYEGMLKDLTTGSKDIIYSNATVSTPTFFDSAKKFITTTAQLWGTWVQTWASKATPVDADTIGFYNSATTFVGVKSTLLNLWTAYFKVKADLLYVKLSGLTTNKLLTFDGTNVVSIAGIQLSATWGQMFGYQGTVGSNGNIFSVLNTTGSNELLTIKNDGSGVAMSSTRHEFGALNQVGSIVFDKNLYFSTQVWVRGVDASASNYMHSWINSALGIYGFRYTNTLEARWQANNDTASTILQKWSNSSSTQIGVLRNDGLYFGTGTKSASAILHLDSTSLGSIPYPRMTNAQRTALTVGATTYGLMVYCTDATEGLYIYKSTGWTFII